MLLWKIACTFSWVYLSHPPLFLLFFLLHWQIKNVSQLGTGWLTDCMTDWMSAPICLPGGYLAFSLLRFVYIHTHPHTRTHTRIHILYFYQVWVWQSMGFCCQFQVFTFPKLKMLLPTNKQEGLHACMNVCVTTGSFKISRKLLKFSP